MIHRLHDEIKDLVTKFLSGFTWHEKLKNIKAQNSQTLNLRICFGRKRFINGYKGKKLHGEVGEKRDKIIKGFIESPTSPQESICYRSCQ